MVNLQAGPTSRARGGWLGGTTPLTPRRSRVTVSHVLVDLLDGDQVAHRVDHAADLRAVLLDDDIADVVQAQRAQTVALVPGTADLGPDLGYLQVLCHEFRLSCSLARRRPRRRSPARLRQLRAPSAWRPEPRARSAGRDGPRSPRAGSGS